MTEDQIKSMVDRFLMWKLPEHFNPDNGISFDPIANKGSPYEFKREPTGTNLFDATQATAMVRYMLDGVSAAQARPNYNEVEALRHDLDRYMAIAQEMTDECERLRAHSPADCAALSAPADGKQAGEAVAWLAEGGACTSERRTASVWEIHFGYKVTPLYTSHQAAVDQAAMREALEKIAYAPPGGVGPTLRESIEIARAALDLTRGAPNV